MRLGEGKRLFQRERSCWELKDAWTDSEERGKKNISGRPVKTQRKGGNTFALHERLTSHIARGCGVAVVLQVGRDHHRLLSDS